MSTLMTETEVGTRTGNREGWRPVRYRPEDLDAWLSELPMGGSRSARRYLEVAGD